MGLILNRRRELGYILPYDKEIEYLESSGTQCIDTLVQLYTGEEATYEIDIKAYQPAGVTNQSIILNTMYEVKPWPGVVLRYEGGYVRCYDMSDQTNVCFPEETFEYKIIKNNITNQTHPTTVTLFSGYDGNGVLWRFGTCKIYYCKIYDHGTLVRDLIPVRIGQVGYMFDRVTRQMFGNIGTGSFILGPDVAPLYDAEIEYLETSSNSQYFLFPFKIVSDNVELYCTYLSAFRGTYSEIVSCFATRSSDGFQIYQRSSGALNVQMVSTNVNVGSVTANTVMPLSAIFKDGNYTITTSTVNSGTYSGSMAVSSGNISIFNYQNASNGGERIYSLKICYNTTTTLDMIPVRIGQVGYLYDKVSKKLYGNSGSGNFVLGPDIV